MSVVYSLREGTDGKPVLGVTLTWSEPLIKAIKLYDDELKFAGIAKNGEWMPLRNTRIKYFVSVGEEQWSTLTQTSE